MHSSYNDKNLSHFQQLHISISHQLNLSQLQKNPAVRSLILYAESLCFLSDLKCDISGMNSGEKKQIKKKKLRASKIIILYSSFFGAETN
jgi:hypothetical protein